MAVDLSPLFISLRTTLVSICIVFFLGTATAAWVMTCSRRLKGFFDTLFSIPLVLPPTVVGFLLLLLLGKNSFLGQVLNAINVQIIFTWQATVISGVVVSFPLMYRTTRGAFEQIDRNITDAARTLGLKEWVIFFRITLPLSLPGLMAGVVLSFSRTLGEFGATLMVSGNIPRQTQTIPIALFFAVESGDMSLAYLWVAVIMLLSLISILLLNLWNGKAQKAASGRWPI